jgi:hypothetical protein
MHRQSRVTADVRVVLVAALALVVVWSFFTLALGGTAAATEVSPNALMTERTLVLQGYIEHYAADHGGTYPGEADVRQGGALESPVWPADPWTGTAMEPGAVRGCFTYTLAADGASYVLVGHRLRRDLVLTGGGATSLDAERDARAAEAADLLRQYILDYARDNNFTAPSSAQVAATGAVGTHAEAGAWPKNPWTGAAMKASSAVGDFAYTRESDWHHFSLAVKTSSGVATVTGDSYASPWKSRRDTYCDRITKLSTSLIRDAVEQWAFDNNDMYPAEYEVAEAGGVGMFFVDLDWPTDPVTNSAMADEAGTGSFDYELEYAGGDWTFSIEALLSNGTFVLGPSYEQYRESKFRLHFKDLVAQSDIQVIKAYIDQYALANGGELPGAPEVTRYGQVGSDHSWWPQNPWTLGDMSQGTDYGEFTYTPGTGGDYTLVLHEMPDPDYPEYYPADYTAQ